MKSYYASSISERISKTPEGFLIARDVPINRIGVQEYLGQELGLPDKYNQMVKVYREPEDVFSNAALASFEAKPTTDDHPYEDVTPNNIGAYGKGHLQNVHRGTGTDDIYTLADVIITEANTISKVENGKREVSCGYHHDLVPYKDGYKQINIVGNHLAIVDKGRAGSKVSIRDSEIKQGVKKLSKKNILFKMLSAFAKDADPEDVEKALDAIAEKTEEPKESKDSGCACCKSKDEEIEKLKKESEDKKSKDEESKGVEGLEEFLKEEKKEPEHEDKTDDSSSEVLEVAPGTKADEGDKPKNPIGDNAIARNIILKALQEFKPVAASIKDSKERKLVCDALASSFRTQLGRPENYQKDGYATIQDAITQKAKATNDAAMAADRSAMFAEDRGLKIAQKYNPHYKA